MGKFCPNCDNARWLVWRPIEHAPVGVDVLAYWKCGRMAVACYTGKKDATWECPLWEVECELEPDSPEGWVPLPKFSYDWLE